MNNIAPSPHASAERSATEQRLREELAACYRLIAHFRMTDLIFTHISVRLPGPEHHFLINPYGLMFEEITASNLVKIDLNGEAVEPSPYPVNPAGFVIHSAIHGAREDAQCVLHTHTKAGCAVAALKCGLLPVNQISMEFYGRVAYHDYEGVALDLGEQQRLVADLGDKSVLMLRNHGLLTVGKTIADAFLSMYTFENTCRIQVDALAGQAGAQDLTAVDPQILNGVAHAMKVQTGGLGGPFVWPSLLRKLQRDNPGYDV